MKHALYLSHLLPVGDARVQAPDGLPSSVTVKIGDELKQVPVAYFAKDVIAAGAYRHPSTGESFTVTPARIDKWVHTFNAMRAAGFEVPTPTDHAAGLPEPRSATLVLSRDNLGFVVKAERVGDRLRLIHQVIGEDAVQVALRNRASIYVHPNFVDEKGRAWGEAIVHSSYTPIPVIGGMGSFVPFAASREQPPAPVFVLSREGTMPMTPEQKKKVVAMLVASGKSQAEAEAMSDSDLLDFLISQLTDEVGELSREKKKAAGLATEVATLKSEKAALEGRVGELSRAAVPPDAEVLGQRLDATIERIDILTERQRITPAQATRLKSMCKTADGKPSPLMLSRAAGAEASAMQLFLGVFNETATPPVPGSQTPNQPTPTPAGNPGQLSREQEDAERDRLLSLSELGRAVLASRK